MKILMLPHNVASDMSNRIEYLERLPNVSIRAFTTWRSSLIEDDKCIHLPAGMISKNIFIKFFAYLKYLRIIQKEVIWADIIHWYWDFTYIPFLKIPLEYFILSYYKKPGFIVWCGSEIRNPNIDKLINPYYKTTILNGKYEYKFESSSRSKRTQFYFSKLKYVPLVFIGIDHYIDKSRFPIQKRIFQVINLKKFKPKYPTFTSSRSIRIVHSASVLGGKGTEYIIKAVEELKDIFNIDFYLIHKLSKSEALLRVSECDLFIDQLITGSHGTAAVEAMAFGKPVLCYINDIVLPNYPPEFPIINVTVNSLQKVLFDLLSNPENLTSKGQESRIYVEKYHNDEVNAINLLENYKNSIL